MKCEREGLDWGWLRCYVLLRHHLLNAADGPVLESLAVSRMSLWPT